MTESTINSKGIRKFFGNKKFYQNVLAITLPIMIQNGITNFVNMLDNVMVGQVGTLQMTGVAVSNQLIFVFNLCVFGAVSGAGIFGSQYYGQRNHEGIKHTFRFKLIFCMFLCFLAIGVFIFKGSDLIMLYLKNEQAVGDIEKALVYAKDYLNVMLVGLVPYAIVQCYSSTLRETEKTVPPMIAGVCAVLINLILNYILIFGHFGAPQLGVVGAAIATVISRYCELAIVSIWTWKNKHNNQFIIGAFKSFYIPKKLIKDIVIKGLPLMLNETFWASGVAVVNQCYANRGMDVVAANNISQTFFNVFAVAFMAVGVAIGIIIGQLLGKNKTDEAMDCARKLITFSVIVGFLIGIVYFVAAIFIPEVYNTEDNIKYLGMRLMQISALSFPLDAFAHASYFTLRSGGKTFITILFDSCFMWVANVPVAFLLSNFTNLNILLIYGMVQLLLIIKDILGFIFVKKGVWLNNLVAESE